METETIQPLTEPLACPKCGCKEIEEILDGAIVATSFVWDMELGRYKQGYEDIDGDGDCYIQCSDCSYRYSSAILEQFDLSNPERL